MKYKLLSLVSAMAVSSVWAAREVVPMMTDWTCDGEEVTLPHTWNAIDGADGMPKAERERLERVAAESDFRRLEVSWEISNPYRAKSYLRKEAEYSHALPDPQPGKRYFFRCEGAGSRATVFVNGVQAGRHLSAYTAFCYELTGLMRPENNTLTVLVDNRWDRDQMNISGDFTAFGGIYRDTMLIVTDPVCIDPTVFGGPGVKVTANPDNGEVAVEVAVSGGAAAATYSVDDRLCTSPRFKVADFQKWSMENPKVYHLTVTLDNGDSVTVPFGFRKTEFRKDGMFYLNGQREKLRGVNRHQDREGKGWAISHADEEEDLAIIREMGANAVRTAHYPQSQHFYDLMDAAGMVAWCELPVNDTYTDSASARANAMEQLQEMVAQYGNHPSIAMWSVYNEIYQCELTERSRLVPALRALAARFRELDPSRPVTAASNGPEKLDANAVPEALGYNVYPGWYGWEGPQSMGPAIDAFCASNCRPAVAISEYGAGASVRQHELPTVAVRPDGKWHPEELQANYHREMYRGIRNATNVWGSFVWNMFDFAADTRHEGDREGRNDKGLVTYDRQTRKDAFYLYQANWTKTPVLRAVGSRLREISAKAPVVAFSNLGPVTLKLNGETIGTQTPDEVMSVEWRDLPYRPGENLIELAAGGERVELKWRRVCETPANWAGARRDETLEWFRHNQFGVTPFGRLPDEQFTDDAVVFTNSGIRIDIEHRLPTGADADHPAPTVLFFDHRGGDEPPDYQLARYPDLPVDEIVKRGYAFVRWNGNDVAPNVAACQDAATFARWPLGILAWAATGDAAATNVVRKADDWGTIGAWAWGNSRVMDWIAAHPEYDAKRVMVVGHSRGGKTALWTAAQDPRFAMAVSSGSGCGGAGLARQRVPGAERFEDILRSFPQWFAPAFGQWIGRDAEVPHDADDLLRLVAPRALYVLSGDEDAWADPAAENSAWSAAHDVYRAYGAEDKMAYHCHDGGHALRPDDWEKILDFADRQFNPQPPVPDADRSQPPVAAAEAVPVTEERRE